RVEGLLVVPAVRAAKGLFLGVDDQPYGGKLLEQGCRGLDLLAVLGGSVEGEVGQGVQQGQGVLDVAPGVGLVQAEQPTQQGVAGVDAQPEQGHEQSVAQVVVGVSSCPDGALAWLAVLGGRGRGA